MSTSSRTDREATSARYAAQPSRQPDGSAVPRTTATQPQVYVASTPRSVQQPLYAPSYGSPLAVRSTPQYATQQRQSVPPVAAVGSTSYAETISEAGGISWAGSIASPGGTSWAGSTSNSNHSPQSERNGLSPNTPRMQNYGLPSSTAGASNDYTATAQSGQTASQHAGQQQYSFSSGPPLARTSYAQCSPQSRPNALPSPTQQARAMPTFRTTSSSDVSSASLPRQPATWQAQYNAPTSPMAPYATPGLSLPSFGSSTPRSQPSGPSSFAPGTAYDYGNTQGGRTASTSAAPRLQSASRVSYGNAVPHPPQTGVPLATATSSPIGGLLVFSADGTLQDIDDDTKKQTNVGRLHNCIREPDVKFGGRVVLGNIAGIGTGRSKLEGVKAAATGEGRFIDASLVSTLRLRSFRTAARRQEGLAVPIRQLPGLAR